MKALLAIALSVVAHVVLLLVLWSLEFRVSPPRPEPAPVTFEIVSAPAPPEVAREVERPSAAPPPRARPVFAIMGPRNAPEPPDTLAPLDPSTEGSGVGVGRGTGPEVEAASPASPEPGPPSPPSAPPDDSAFRALLHQRLAAGAQRCYPAAAKRFNQRGTVGLAFCTDENARVSSRRLVTSASAPLLDSAALGCVLDEASPLPLEAARRCFTVPVRFGAP